VPFIRVVVCMGRREHKNHCALAKLKSSLSQSRKALSPCPRPCTDNTAKIRFAHKERRAATMMPRIIRNGPRRGKHGLPRNAPDRDGIGDGLHLPQPVRLNECSGTMGVLLRAVEKGSGYE
jgi:hypothetical protein